MLKITHEQFREMLNKSLPFNYILKEAHAFFAQPEVRNPILNNLKERAEMYPKYSMNTLLKWFVEDTISLVEGTTLCSNLYQTQTFLKTIWETSMMGSDLLKNIRNNIVLETPTSIAEQEALTPGEAKALKMREAKAKKKAEKDELERLQKEKQEILEAHRQNKAKAEANKEEPVVQSTTKQKELTPEQQAHLQFLRSL